MCVQNWVLIYLSSSRLFTTISLFAIPVLLWQIYIYKIDRNIYIYIYNWQTDSNIVSKYSIKWQIKVYLNDRYIHVRAGLSRYGQLYDRLATSIDPLLLYCSEYHLYNSPTTIWRQYDLIFFLLRPFGEIYCSFAPVLLKIPFI